MEKQELLIKKRNVLDSLDSEFQAKLLSSAGSDTLKRLSKESRQRPIKKERPTTTEELPLRTSLATKCSPNYPSASRIGWKHTRHSPLLLQHSKTFLTLKSRFFCTDQIANSAYARARTCCFQWHHFLLHEQVHMRR